MKNNLIKNFKQLSKNDTKIAGGKGASLGEMTQAKIPVPGGFVILANAFERFIKETNLDVKIDKTLDKVNIKKVQTVKDASKKIKAMFLSREIPEDIKIEIIKNYKILDCKFFAVRSSATSEDSASAAWAGQLDSYLNTTEKTLIENVKNCWASLFTPRAIFYRFEKKLSKDKISVAVVVQKMVKSEESGIAFSVHPVTQDENQIIIEAGFGLGEAIVSGSITPDAYIINKQGFKILDIDINDQTKALYKKSKGGNEWKELGEKGKKQVLTEKEIIELSKLIVKIEKHYGFPCDIEWAKEKREFNIVQSRPITTLREKKPKNQQKVYKKIFNRYLPIYAAEYNYIGKTETIKKITGGSANFPPLYINIPGKGNDVYYDEEMYELSSKRALEYFKGNPQEMKKISDDYKKICEANFDFIKNAKIKDIKKLFNLNANYISPMMTILILIGREEFDKEIKGVAHIAKKIRYWNDKILYEVGLKIFELINTKFSWSQNCDKADYITIKESLASKPISLKEINKRKKSWILLEGKKLYTGNKIEDFLLKNNIILKKEKIIENLENIHEIKGNVARNGIAKGKAKIVFTMDDLFKVQKGDIIVSSMTGPDFMIAIKKSAGIITDEGGITCHAAIVSRELKIPCIIGTKIATRLLKDGMEVEVDANQGVVRIIDKVKK